MTLIYTTITAEHISCWAPGETYVPLKARALAGAGGSQVKQNPFHRPVASKNYQGIHGMSI